MGEDSLFSLVSATALAQVQAAAPNPARPNIIFMLADILGCELL